MRVAISPSSFGSSPEPMELLKRHGIEVIDNPYGRRLTEEEIIKHLVGIDGLIAGLEPLNKNVLSSTSQLKAIARVGIGIANVDLEAAKDLDIRVSNTPEAPTEAVAEMCLSALLTLARNLMPMNTALHQREWKKMIGLGVRGMNVLFVGYGRIGQKFAELLRFLGANILVYDPYLDGTSLKLGEEQVTLDQGLKVSDVVTLHASGEGEILNKEHFQRMDGTILLNSARGELVNEADLIEALDNEMVKYAWFDAFWEEPYKGKLCEYEQVLMTPHSGTYTSQCRMSMEVAAVNNLLRDLGYSQS